MKAERPPSSCSSLGLSQCDESVLKIAAGDHRTALRLLYRLLLLNADAVALNGPPDKELPSLEVLARRHIA